MFLQDPINIPLWLITFYTEELWRQYTYIYTEISRFQKTTIASTDNCDHSKKGALNSISAGEWSGNDIVHVRNAVLSDVNLQFTQVCLDAKVYVKGTVCMIFL